MQDALGNAVHTVLAGPVEGRTVLVTGMGPIGLFSVAVAKAMGASKVYATEVSRYRADLAKKLGADLVLDPLTDDVPGTLSKLEPLGIDATLEMSGHPSSFALALEQTKPGGRISLLGIYPEPLKGVDLNEAIFKGIELQGIVGRKIWDTWDKMTWLLTEKGLDVSPVITHHLPFADFEEAMCILNEGKAGKIVLDLTSEPD
jgi:threonine 3-dehydrogenase